MPNKTKAKIANIGEALGKKAKEFTFIDPPMVDAPFTQIRNLDDSNRQLPDPSKTLKPAMGVERIEFSAIELSTKEKFNDGTSVYKMIKDDPRVRFFGEVDGTNTFGGSKTGFTITFLSTANEGFEVTYFGTGINLMIQQAANDGRYMEVVADGVVQPNIVVGSSTILNVRNTKVRSIYNAVKGQTLGIHTVKFKIGPSGSLPINGIEILNESTQIQIPQGEIFAAGNKYANDTLVTTDYNADFDNSPVLNGRGGRVSIYMTPQGEIKKAIQQTDNTQLNLSLVDHSNEEVISRINWREFGLNRADDFSTLTSSNSDRAFTLDDGATTLIGDDVRTGSTMGVRPSLTGDKLTFTFIGTGLDFYCEHSVTSNTAHEVIIDGVSVGNLVQIDSTKTEKIVSGLPYGSHTVQISKIDASSNIDIEYFIVYGPKKPTIPDNAQEISEYFLMADYDGTTATGTAVADQLQRPKGVLQKCSEKELVYSGTWIQSGGVQPDNPSGFFINTSTLNDFYEYTFTGTGIVIHHAGTVSGTYSFEVQIDGATNDAGVARSNVSNDGSGNYSTTVATSNAPVRLEFTGLTMGAHTIKVTLKTAARNMGMGALYIITPIHFPNTKSGSQSMSPGTQLQTKTASGGVDLGKAKAWAKYSTLDGSIISSHNVSAIIEVSTQLVKFYWDTPFKSEPTIVATTSGTQSAIPRGIEDNGTGLADGTMKPGVTIGCDSVSNFYSVVAYGELEGEE